MIVLVSRGCQGIDRRLKRFPERTDICLRKGQGRWLSDIRRSRTWVEGREGDSWLQFRSWFGNRQFRDSENLLLQKRPSAKLGFTQHSLP